MQFKLEHSWDNNVRDDETVVIHLGTEPKDFMMVLTTRQLIQHARKQGDTQHPFFHIDATYKLLSNGFLLLTMSTEDPQHHGRLIAVALALHENTVAYTNFITQVKRFMSSTFKYN